MKICSNCGKRMIDPTALYCMNCGDPLKELPVQYICSNENCKRHNIGFPFDFARYCDFCGSPVVRVEPAEGE